MIYPSGDKLEKQVGSRFALVMAVSKRAKQLREGSPAQVETRSTNFITIALEEIAAGKLTITIPTQEQMDLAERQEGVPKTAAREAAELLKRAADEELAVEGVEASAEPAPAPAAEIPVEGPVEEPAVETAAEPVEEEPVVGAKPKGKPRKKATPKAVEEPEATEEVIEAAPEVVEEAPAKKVRAKKSKTAEPEVEVTAEAEE